ncbi:cysteine hydrolase family protein [Nocardioides sp. DS6]|uniref:Cysteine hydrolase family protein n=1 Tax=Nocardioides eburneus TaxID=3231482 RepID=A0ABV3SXG4_9ACTN
MDPRTTAVLLVHLEGDIVTAEGAFGPVFAAQVAERDVLGATARFLESVRPRGVTPVFLRIAFTPSYDDLVATIPLLAMTEHAGALKDGTPGAEIVAHVAPLDGDVVVTHQRPGPFHGSVLQETLAARGITTVLVGGVATNASVEMTFRQAADHGYETVLVEDLCSAADQAAHEASIGSMRLFGRIASSDEILAELAGP